MSYTDKGNGKMGSWIKRVCTGVVWIERVCTGIVWIKRVFVGVVLLIIVIIVFSECA